MRGISMIWQRHTLPDVTPVPFAQMGLTSLFGMGRGGHHCYSHHNFFRLLANIVSSNYDERQGLKENTLMFNFYTELVY